MAIPKALSEQAKSVRELLASRDLCSHVSATGSGSICFSPDACSALVGLVAVKFDAARYERHLKQAEAEQAHAAGLAERLAFALCTVVRARGVPQGEKFLASLAALMDEGGWADMWASTLEEAKIDQEPERLTDCPGCGEVLPAGVVCKACTTPEALTDEQAALAEATTPAEAKALAEELGVLAAGARVRLIYRDQVRYGEYVRETANGFHRVRLEGKGGKLNKNPVSVREAPVRARS